MKMSWTLPLAMLIVTSACTSKSASKAPDDSVTIDLPVQVGDTSGLSSDESAMLSKIKDHKPVSFTKLTELMALRHIRAAHSSVTSAELIGALRAMSSSADVWPYMTKIRYEKALKVMHGGKDLVYNIDKSNVLDLYKEGRMQCYSGTYFYELVRRQRGAQEFRQGNEVVIFQSGHVLPGYMIRKDGGYKLVGVETTQSGAARIYYGAADQLSGVRVVDADMFAVVEVFSQAMSNTGEVVAAALASTAKRYGIHLESGVESAGDGVSATGLAATRKMLNQSPFGFGEPADPTPGDRERTASGDDGGRTDTQMMGGQVVAMAALMPNPEFESIVGNHCIALGGGYMNYGPVGYADSVGSTLQIEAKGCDQIRISSRKEDSRRDEALNTVDFSLQSANPISGEFIFQNSNGESLSFVVEQLDKSGRQVARLRMNGVEMLRVGPRHPEPGAPTRIY